MKRVAVVGATGAVGRAVVDILETRRFPVQSLRLFSSPKSGGQTVTFAGKNVRVEVLSDDEPFSNLDVVFFTAGSKVSESHAFRAAGAGALVVDNASLFRMRPDVPLVVPEINADTLELARKTRVVANPNCTTAQLVMALKPLHDRFKLKRVIVSSYQAVSGKGHTGIEEFNRQVKEFAAGKKVVAKVFPHPIAFNCLPHIDVFAADGFTGEEHKVMNETRKILGLPSLQVLATCVRVPVPNCHSESVFIETENPTSPKEAHVVLSKMKGVRVIDDPMTNTYPLASDASGKDDVFVGRIRQDPNSKCGLTFWVVADNLRKGAALNAVQIAEAWKY